MQNITINIPEMNNQVKRYKCPGYLFCQYILLHNSTIKIGNENNVSCATIRNWLKKFNIPIRSYAEARKGKKHTNKTKKKISLALKGRMLTKEHIDKLKPTQFKKGHIPWNKDLPSELQPLYGKKHSETTKQKIRDKKIGKTRPDITGKRNGRWKGDEVGYHALHTWMREHYPKPKQCKRCNKKTEKLELSNISGAYKRDIEDFEWLCHSCHIKYEKDVGRWGTLKISQLPINLNC